MRMLKNTAKRQAGYLLLEATLAFSVAAGLMTFYIRERAVQATEDLAKAHGEQMKRISDAANQYALDNFAAIMNNAAVNLPPSPQCPGGGVVANTRRPTLGEFSCMGLLPAGFGAVPPLFGGGYQLQLIPQPVGCAPGTCTRIGGMLMTTAPVLPNGQLSAQVIGRALQAIGAGGGATGMGGQACVAGACPMVGVNGGWTEPVILAGITPAAGLMGVQVGYDPNLWLRLDGTSTMGGDIQVGGNAIDLARRDAANNIISRGNIRNANEVSATTVNANTANAITLNATTVNAPNLTTPDATTPITVNRRLVMGLNDIDKVYNVNTVNVNAEQVVNAQLGMNAGTYLNAKYINMQHRYSDGTLVPNAYGTLDNVGVINISRISRSGDGCTPGQVGRESDGALLECISGTWRRISSSY